MKDEEKKDVTEKSKKELPKAPEDGPKKNCCTCQELKRFGALEIRVAALEAYVRKQGFRG